MYMYIVTMSWPLLLQYLGSVGLLNRVDVDEKRAVISISVRNIRFHVVTAALKKVHKSGHKSK